MQAHLPAAIGSSSATSPAAGSHSLHEKPPVIRRAGGLTGAATRIYDVIALCTNIPRTLRHSWRLGRLWVYEYVRMYVGFRYCYRPSGVHKSRDRGSHLRGPQQIMPLFSMRNPIEALYMEHDRSNTMSTVCILSWRPSWREQQTSDYE